MREAPVALVELYGHNEVVYALCHCCAAAAIPAKVFTTSEAFAEAPPALKHPQCGISWYVQPEGQSVPGFLGALEGEINTCRALILTTVAGDYRFFARKTWAIPAVLLIHDGNCWLRPFCGVRFRSFSDLGRWVMEWLRLRPVFRTIIVKKMSRVAFPSREIQDFLVSRGRIAETRCLPPLLFGVSEPEAGWPPPSHEGTVMVIPGTITVDSRDYRPLLEAFRKIQPLLQHPVALVLLGKARKKREARILEQFRELGQGLLSVITFRETIPQREYDYWLQHADFLILPLRQDMYYGICRERGGLTKISGTINDMIRFGIPTLISRDYVVGETLEPAVCRYDNSEALANLLLDWINNRTYLEWRANNQDLWKQFAPEMLGLELKAIFDRSMA